MILYKYLQPARLDVLRTKRIRFTRPGDFNDPFEFRPRIESTVSGSEVRQYVEDNFDSLLEEELAKYGSLVELIPKDTLKLILSAQKTNAPQLFKLLEPEIVGFVSPLIDRFLNQSVGVLCLSEIRDSLLMWGHYTENHTGFVVGFDSEHPFFSKRKTEQDEFGFLRRVQYQRERPSVVLSDTSSPVWFQTKSEEWAYEKEWRIARVLSEASERINVAPFPICLFEFPHDAVLEIIIGLRASSTTVQEIQSKASFFPRARLLRATESPSDYALLINDVSAANAAR
jgi:hypothetical protein